jgi:dihydrofolate reductase
MARLTVFNSVSVDGYFTDRNSDMSWAHRHDPEWTAFTTENASGGAAVLLFGRITYEMMLKHWPTEEAKKDSPEVAEGMNNLPKVVFSRTLHEVTWKNTRLVRSDIAAEVREMKHGKGPDMVLMGSGTIVAQLTGARLIDEYQLVQVPIILGAGRTLFEGVEEKVKLKLKKTRAFKNGNVVLWYEPEGVR